MSILHTIQKLLKSPDLNIRLVAVAYPENNGEILLKAFQDVDPLVRIEAAKHPKATTELLKMGAKDPHLGVVIEVVKNRAATPEVIIEAFEHCQNSILMECVVKSNCPAQILEYAFKNSNDIDILRAVFINKNAPYDILWHGIHHSSAICRFATCLNTAATPEILMIGMQDSASHIRNYASSALKRLSEKA